MNILSEDQATTIVPAAAPPDADRVVVLRNDVESLSAYEAAARTIFVEANGLQVYYRTYYSKAGKAGWGASSRKGDPEQVVWREGLPPRD